MADVLIVDDDSDTAELLAELLQHTGHTTRVACDGREGLVRLDERLPDVVVLDVEMPKLTGPEMALEMFLHNRGLETVPIVLCSGALDLETFARHVGTGYFLAKPYDASELLALIERAIVERTPPRRSASEARS